MRVSVVLVGNFWIKESLWSRKVIMLTPEFRNQLIMSAFGGSTQDGIEDSVSEIFESKAASARIDVHQRMAELDKAHALSDEDKDWIRYGRRGKPSRF